MAAEADRARWTQLPALAWTHARAFGGAAIDELRGAAESPRSDDISRVVAAFRMTAAVLVLPMSTILVISALLRRGLYASKDARSLIVIKRYALVPEVLAALIVISVPVLVLIGTIAVAIPVAFALGSNTVLVVTMTVVQWSRYVIFAWTVLGALLLVSGSLLRKEHSIKPVGDETPKGECWVVESLAARRADDKAAALRLALRTSASVEKGKVLVAVARTNALRDGYEKWGFTVGEKNRIYLKT